MVHVREGKPGDIPALVDVWERSIKASFTFMPEEEFAKDKPRVKEELETLPFWVAEVDGKPAGFICMEGYYVAEIFTDPECKGKGLGTVLIAAAQKARPGGQLVVHCKEQNESGLAFYLAKGFKQIDRWEKDKHGKPYPTLHLVLDPPDAR